MTEIADFIERCFAVCMVTVGLLALAALGAHAAWRLWVVLA